MYIQLPFSLYILAETSCRNQVQKIRLVDSVSNYKSKITKCEQNCHRNSIH